MRRVPFVAVAALAALAARAETLAIVGGRVHTMTVHAAIENGTVIVRDGRIVAVGAGLAAPADARRIDAAGKIVTPGLMSAGSQLGLVEVSAAGDTADQNVDSVPLGAAFDVSYALNPNSTLLPQARADGLTRAMTYPGRATHAPFAGMGAVLRLVDGHEIVDRRQVAVFARAGGLSSSAAGGSRAAQWVLMRNALDEARVYRPSRTPGAPRDQLANRLDIEALRAVVEGRMPLAILAERESDIREAVRLAQDHDVRVVVLGGTEAWRVAQLLAARRIPVVLDPFENLPATFDQIGARLDNAAILHRAGVLIAFAVPGIRMSHDAGAVIREAAGVAVANGLPHDAALRALTADAAAIWGIADHYGTLAPGRDADIVIWDADPLEPTSAPERVFVRGREVSLETRQRALAERYAPARRTQPWPPPYR